MKKNYCKSCYSKNLLKVIKIGKSPPCDEYLRKRDLKKKSKKSGKKSYYYIRSFHSVFNYYNFPTEI